MSGSPSGFGRPCWAFQLTARIATSLAPWRREPSRRVKMADMRSRFSVAAPAGLDLPTDVVTYGPDVPREATLKLLGNVEGKRILYRGSGAGHHAIALAKQRSEERRVGTACVRTCRSRW